MKTATLLFFALFTGSQLTAQSLYFPPTDSDEWETLSPESLGWCTDQIPELYEYLEEKNTKAFLVLKDGKIVLEKYFDSFTKDSTWYWASAGKCITAALTGIAQQEGLLSIADATADYLGEGWTSCTPEQELAITVRNQLTMTAGLDESFEANCTDPECLIYKANPGDRWSYHNSPYTLLSEVIASASGTTFNGFCNTRLEAQTGMSGAFIPVDDNKVYFSVPRDMARFGLMILNEGYWDGEGVLTDSEYFAAMTNTSQDLNESYGYLWWLNGKSTFMLPQTEMIFDGPILPNAPSDLIAALGKNDQFLNVVPSQNLLVVRMGNNPGGIEDLVPTALNNTIWDYLNGIMCEVSETAEEILPEVTLYPNPATDQVWVEYPTSANYQIFNLNGHVMQQGSINQGLNQLETSPFESGIYLLRITSGEATQTVRFNVL